eukprot:TRINITY_DN5075_c0_g2_i2.p1 TRINITY_DN5075_c0_g2~~TRINITY_DN5075_c0_g2_i2.p1  ORF type:complete len:765 (+),score=172.87 TRINITY_DN5075_c0_g2_i2:87-2381(+)
MLIKVSGSPAAFKKVQAAHKDKAGTLDVHLANTRPIEGKQIERLIDVMTGKPKEEGEGRPNVPPEELVWRHVLRKTDPESGEPIGEPLDLTQTPVSQGIKSRMVLHICLASEYTPSGSAVSPSKQADDKNKPPPNPTGGNKTPPPNPTGGDKKPPPNPTGGDKKPPPNPTGGDKKPPPNPTGGDKKPPPNPTGGDKKPPPNPTGEKKSPSTTRSKSPSTKTRSKSPSAATGGSKSPTPKSGNRSPNATIRTRSPVKDTYSRERSDSDILNMPSPDDDIAAMKEKMRYYQQQIDKSRERLYSDDDSYRRRRGMDDIEEDSLRRQREMIHLSETDRLHRLEDQLRQKEYDVQRREKDLRWREEQVEEERKRTLQRSPPREMNTAAADAAASATSDQAAVGILQSLQTLHQENKDLRTMVAELKEKQLLQQQLAQQQQQQQQQQQPYQNSQPSSPTAQLHRILLDAGLSHFESVLHQNQLDRDTLELATPTDLTEIGMSEREAQRLLNSIKMLPPHLQSPPRMKTAVESYAPPKEPFYPPMEAVRVPLPVCAEDVEFHRSVLASFFARHDPPKVTSVSQVVQELISTSGLDQFYPALINAYGLERSPYSEKVAQNLDVGRQSAAVVLCDVWKGQEGELLQSITGLNPKWTEYMDNDRYFYYSETFNLSQWKRPFSVSMPEHRSLAASAFADSVVPHADTFLPHGMEGHQRSGSSPHRQLKKYVDHYRAWVIAFLLKHDQKRVSEADDLLNRYSGPELVEILSQQYNA